MSKESSSTEKGSKRKFEDLFGDQPAKRRRKLDDADMKSLARLVEGSELEELILKHAKEFEPFVMKLRKQREKEAKERADKEAAARWWDPNGPDEQTRLYELADGKRVRERFRRLGPDMIQISKEDPAKDGRVSKLLLTEPDKDRDGDNSCQHPKEYQTVHPTQEYPGAIHCGGCGMLNHQNKWWIPMVVECPPPSAPTPTADPNYEIPAVV